jgi:hypothetical protein
VITIKNNLFHDINSDDTFIILNGVISLRRGENMLVGIARRLYYGVSDGVMKTDIQYRLITESDCTGYHLPASQTINIVEQNNFGVKLSVGWYGIVPWNNAICS